MAHVSIRNLVKTYPEKNGPGVRAVNGINLEVNEGEFMVLVGPSGCGKSTTLRMIAGLEEISGGTISIDGRVVNDVLPKDRDIAMVFQNYALYPHMSVYDNLAFGLKLRKFSKSQIDQRVREAAAMLGLEALLDRRPKALSGGQRQRVAVGRAIVRKPKVFLFDEPLSNLDAKMRVSTRAEIARLHDRLGATMIYVTHDQVEAMTMGDRICVMKDGAIMQVAPPLELYRRPENQFVAGFIGSPPMNFFRGTVEVDATGARFVTTQADGRTAVLHLPGQLARLAAGKRGEAAVLGIRPENLRHVASAAAGRTIAFQVEIAEPMGAETYIYCKVGHTPATARVDAQTHYEPGQLVHLAFELDHAHLFDAASEQVLQ